MVELPAIRSEDLSSWQLQIRYSYVVRGATYRSTRYAFGYGNGSEDAKHRRVADALRRSPQLRVHYDPARPSEAVIDTTPQTSLMTLGHVSLAMAAVSASIWFTARC